MYRGQTALIRRTMREYELKYEEVMEDPNYWMKKRKYPEEFHSDENQRTSRNISQAVKIYTVDMYQGDENDFVIVSLVRSNPEKKIGFLAERNRRCVAQSRARCGIYFIGNHEMFKEHPTWGALIKKLMQRDCLGDRIGLVCKEHPEDPPFMVENSEALTLHSFCRTKCNHLMSCHDHKCQKFCQPPHTHRLCEVKFTFNAPCGHQLTRLCEQEEHNVECNIPVEFEFPNCGHPGKRKCFQKELSVRCYTNVLKELKCGHTVDDDCYKSIDLKKCQEQCARTRPCEHTCSNHKCFEHHEEMSNQCPDCKVIEEERKKQVQRLESERRRENQELVEQQIRRIQENESEESKKISTVELRREEATLSKYFEIEDAIKR